QSPTDIYTLSLHDALPILRQENKSIQNGEIDNGVDDPNDSEAKDLHQVGVPRVDTWLGRIDQDNRAVGATIHLSSLKFVVFTNADRKSTRLNSSHRTISYA